MRNALLIAFVACLIARSALADESLRNWESADGKYSIEAAYVSADAENVKLRKETGEEIVVPLVRLSDADRLFVAKELAATCKISLGIQFVSVDEVRAANTEKLRQEPDAELAEAVENLPKAGLFVMESDPEGGYADSGGKPRDIIVRVDRQFVGSYEKFYHWAAAAKVGETYRFDIKRINLTTGNWYDEVVLLKATDRKAPEPPAQVHGKTDLHLFKVGGGELAVKVESPIVYLPATGQTTYYGFLFHAFRGSDGKVQRDRVGFYSVEGKAVEIQLASDKEELFTIEVDKRLGVVLTAKEEGQANIKIDFSGETFLVPLKFVRVQFKEGDDGEQVIQTHGLPDKEEMHYTSWPNAKSYDGVTYSPDARQGIIKADHWQFEKLPYLVVSIVNGKVYRIGSYRESDEFTYWMLDEEGKEQFRRVREILERSKRE